MVTKCVTSGEKYLQYFYQAIEIKNDHTLIGLADTIRARQRKMMTEMTTYFVILPLTFRLFKGGKFNNFNSWILVVSNRERKTNEIDHSEILFTRSFLQRAKVVALGFFL